MVLLKIIENYYTSNNINTVKQPAIKILSFLNFSNFSKYGTPSEYDIILSLLNNHQLEDNK
jgi:hypothetical protein